MEAKTKSTIGDSLIPTNRAKILMLHGHGQSADFFYYKTRFLYRPTDRKSVAELADIEEAKLWFAQNFQFSYLDAPFTADWDQDGDCRQWGYGDFEQGRVQGVEQSISLVMETIKREGPFVGIIGFSTGAALAAIVASLIELSEYCVGSDEKPLRAFHFIVAFSGFKLEHSSYEYLYEFPIQTPTIHFIGQLDSFIPESLTLQLAQKCAKSTLKYFYGTHHIPRCSDTVRCLSDFISQNVNLDTTEGVKTSLPSLHLQYKNEGGHGYQNYCSNSFSSLQTGDLLV
ncbi:Ovarian cancer-associated protein 2 [Aspergillus hancockii]|nr:Ovarian cancer-associated protein 2 [Aspergillus hancockii]